MGRRGQQTFSKRQREYKKAEKARRKQDKRDARKDTDTPPAGQEEGPASSADEESGEK